MRKEAVTLLSCIYDTQKVPIPQLDSIFSTLAHCAVNDLHWEVKTRALEFWEVIIKHQIQHQGVIDGTFPTVTFSKEKKKIVNLTQKEIILRLTKILNELSMRGCLGVLLACIEDDADLAVARSSVAVIKNLVEFLDKYNYWQEVQDLQQTGAAQPLPVFDTNYSEVNMRDLNEVQPERTAADMTESDEIIQSIVSSQDINLLATAYENQLNVEATPEIGIDTNYYKTFAMVTAHVFLSKVKTTDLDEIIRIRTDWLDQTESFTSLLNDMLYSLKIDNVNDVDCY